MKAKLNLTIEKSVLNRIKAYATSNNISISELVERYFMTISKPKAQQNIIDIVEGLKPVKFDVNVDLKEAYYKEKGSKYGI